MGGQKNGASIIALSSMVLLFQMEPEGGARFCGVNVIEEHAKGNPNDL